jgi:hypothetical protein
VGAAGGAGGGVTMDDLARLASLGTVEEPEYVRVRRDRVYVGFGVDAAAGQE